MNLIMYVFGILLMFFTLGLSQDLPAGDAALGTKTYDQYETPQSCKSCHTDFYEQWTQSMMSQAYTHHWDEIEYFKLAVPHAEKDEMVADVKAGCNGCHAPMAFMAGKVPPPRPEENTRANEAVACDICHTIKGADGDVVFNYNYISNPGRVKYGNKEGKSSPHHDTQYLEFTTTPKLCGTCHNEKSPYDVLVKSTQLEWEQGPYAEEGVYCHDCHMPKFEGQNAKMAKTELISQHYFPGGHVPAKLNGVVEMVIYPMERELPFDVPVQLKVQLYNAKAGHKFPTGSVEDRIRRGRLGCRGAVLQGSRSRRAASLGSGQSGSLVRISEAGV